MNFSKLEYKYRLARPTDAKTIAAMSRDLIEDGLNWSWNVRRILKNIQCPNTVVLVAESDSKLVAFAIMAFGLERAHLNLLAVKPGHRRQGVGSGLISWLEESAMTAGISMVYLEVRNGKLGARTFYESLGYKQCEVIPGYYCKKETAIRMVHRFSWIANKQ